MLFYTAFDSIKLAEQILETIEPREDRLFTDVKIAKGLNYYLKGKYVYSKSDLVTAIGDLEKASELLVATGVDSVAVLAYLRLSPFYCQKGDYDEVLNYFYASLDVMMNIHGEDFF